jgi:uncharacterized protein YcfJ
LRRAVVVNGGDVLNIAGARGGGAAPRKLDGRGEGNRLMKEVQKRMNHKTRYTDEYKHMVVEIMRSGNKAIRHNRSS